MFSAWVVFTASLRLTFNRIGLLVVVGILWWLLSLLIVTWPPATAGMFYVVRRLTILQQSEQTTWRHFFEGIRRYWLQSWQIMAINLVMAIVIVVSLFFYVGQAQFLLRMVSVPVFYILLVWLGMQLYIFPLLMQQEDKRIRLIFKNALLLAVGNVIFTLGLGSLLFSLALVTTTFMGPALFVLITFLAVASTLGSQEMLGIREKVEKKEKRQSKRF